MEQDDIAAAGFRLRDGAVHDLIGPWPLPVAWVDAHADVEIAEAGRRLERSGLVGRFRFHVLRVGWPKQRGLPAGQALDEALRRRKLELESARRQLRDVRMGERVIADLIALLEFAFEKLRRRLRIRADDEERRGDMLAFQRVENGRRVRRVRPVVEGESDLFLRRAVPVDDVGRRKGHERLRGDQSLVRIEDDLARASLRDGREFQDLAVAFVIDVVAVLDGRKTGGESDVIRRFHAEESPDGRVLASQPPQGITGRLRGRSRRDLVEARYGVEHPHLMRRTRVIRVVERRVHRGVVEVDVAFRFFRRQHGLLEGRLFRRLSLRPVVGVIADGNDEFRRRDVMRTFGDDVQEPVLAGDRPGVAGAPMLVIGHDDAGVGRRRDFSVFEARIIGRDVDGHFQAGRFRFQRQRLYEGREKRLVAVNNAFEVEADPVVAALCGIQDETVHETGAGFRRTERGRQQVAAPAATIIIVHQSEDFRRRLVRADVVDRQPLAVRVVGREIAGRVMKMEPFTDHRVEPRQVFLQ